MSRLWFTQGILVLMLATSATPAHAQSWGTLKGQVVVAGAVPEPRKLEVTKDQMHCLGKGALYSERYVVNPKNKGVRWVMVWLTDAKSATKALPIHPSLEKVSPDKVVVDQPRCQFVPHVIGVREGQAVEFKNSAPVAHNVNVQGGLLGPNLNSMVPPGKSLDLTGVKARATPIPFSCSIHPWMVGYARVFKHPYFAVTDEDGKFEIKNAPAGDFRLVIWQETTGWVAADGSKEGTKLGAPVTIKADGVTDLGEIKLPISSD